MTDIDLKRLAEDREYWDSVAPLGATHYWLPSGDWYQDCGDFAVAWMSGAENWGHGFAAFRISRPEIIPRPAKKVQEVEWDGEGLPPVGVVCEVLHMGKTWELVEIVAHVKSIDGSKAVWQMIGYNEWSGDSADKFRPLHTPEQRHRDESVKLISYHPIYKNAVVSLADDILSRYTLEPKQ
ncbi:hypothetical protein [Sinomicrobium sp.]